MYVYYCRTYEKAVSGGGEREKGGHALRDTTSRGLYVRVFESGHLAKKMRGFVAARFFFSEQWMGTRRGRRGAPTGSTKSRLPPVNATRPLPKRCVCSRFKSIACPWIVHPADVLFHRHGNGCRGRVPIAHLWYVALALDRLCSPLSRRGSGSGIGSLLIASGSHARKCLTPSVLPVHRTSTFRLSARCAKSQTTRGAPSNSAQWHHGWELRMTS
jgi:hypothetical protein